MEIYDILMLIVLVATTIFGFYKGMAWQVASIASIVVSYLAAINLGPRMAPYINADEPWDCFIAMLIVFLAVSLGIWLAFRMVAGVIDRVQLREFDRHIGGVLGFAKGVLLCVVITFFAVTMWEQTRPMVLASQSGGYIARLIDRADAIMPPQVHDVLGPHIHRLEMGLDADADPDAHPDDYHGHAHGSENDDSSGLDKNNQPIGSRIADGDTDHRHD